MAAAAPAAAAAAGGSNKSFYMRNAIISMVTLMVVQNGVNYLMGKEEYVACKLGVNDNRWEKDRYQSWRMYNPKETVHTTQYVAMHDGVELAVDTYVHDFLLQNHAKIPTILHLTRHGRGYTVDFPFSYFTTFKTNRFINPRTSLYINRFISNGYAWVSVDIRGTGASMGSKQFDFVDQEKQDAQEILDWIVAQPWSDGQVVAFGHGLEGISALLAASTKHPALKAITLNSAPIDLYDDAFFPGGIMNKKAIKDFSTFTADLDRQKRWRDIPTLKPRLMMKYFGGNVYPVNGDLAKVAQAASEHAKNPDVQEELEHVKFRDDALPTVGLRFDQIDPLRLIQDVADSGVAVYSFGGYYDAAIARSAIELHQYLNEKSDLPEYQKKTQYRLTLGPWSHAGVENCDPYALSKQKCFWHLDEISRFLDFHLFPERREYTGIENEDPIHYFSMVHTRWHSAKQWPPAHIDQERVFYLSLNGSMEDVNTFYGEQLVKQINGTSPMAKFATRWDITAHFFQVKPFYYVDRRPFADFGFASFVTPPLPLIELTGEVELRVFFSVNKPTIKGLFAYLEDIDDTPPFKNEQKRPGVTYMTEAVVNPVHQIPKGAKEPSYLRNDARELKPGVIYEAVLKFLPISYVVKRDHQLRVLIGLEHGSNDFGLRQDDEATELTIHFGGEYASSLTIPHYEGLYMETVLDGQVHDESASEEPEEAQAETTTDDEFEDVSGEEQTPTTPAPEEAPVKETPAKEEVKEEL